MAVNRLQDTYGDVYDPEAWQAQWGDSSGQEQQPAAVDPGMFGPPEVQPQSPQQDNIDNGSVSLTTPTGAIVQIPRPGPLSPAELNPPPPAPAATPAGFDPTKWNNPNYGSEKYKAGHIIANGGTIQQAAAAVGGTVVGKDLIMMPNGEVYDAIFDVGGANAPMWEYQWGGTGPGTHPQGGSTSASTGTGGASTGTGGNGLVSPGATGPRFEDGYAPPGDPGVFGSELLQQLGQDPLSQLITSGLAGLILEGGTPFGSDLQETLRGLISRGGAVEGNDTSGLEFERAREMFHKGQRTLLNDARGNLASRNLLSEPGSPQGSEISAVRRIQEATAPEFAAGLRDIQINRAQANDQRLSEALTLATGMAQDQADTMIAALGEGTNRQKALSDIALGVLDRNMIWNQFLANYGLDRDRLLNEIQQGNIDQLLPIFQLFMQFASLSRGGTI